ncbi:MAG: thioredoxin 2 [Gammaproteobacteria bacterium]|jgi:thioredoxin 2|nr:thioredoxin 2 [Gammaproteobacteria bacterium]
MSDSIHVVCGHCDSVVGLQLRFAKLNTQDEPGPGAQFNIRSIPTMVVFRGGKEIGRQTGAMDSTTMMRWLTSLL